MPIIEWEAEYTQVQVRGLSQGNTGTHEDKHQWVHMLTTEDNLDKPVHLTVMFLDCGGKLEYLERTHTSKNSLF